MTVLAVNGILAVTDMERAIAFYRDALGFTLVERPAPWWSNLSCPGGGLGLNSYPGATPGKTEISFSVASLESACAIVEAHGGDTVKVHGVHPGSTVRLAEIRDTEGNELLLAERVRTAAEAQRDLDS